MKDYQKQGEDAASKYGLQKTVDGYAYKKFFDGDKEKHLVFTMTIKRMVKGKMEEYTFDLGSSIVTTEKALTDKFSVDKSKYAPDWYTLLACITKYDPGTFEDFCSEYGYGYDEDSRRAETVYKAVVKEYRAMCRLFPEGIPEEIIDIA